MLVRILATVIFSVTLLITAHIDLPNDTPTHDTPTHETQPRKIWDLNKEEREFYRYVSSDMYQSVYDRIPADATQQEINEAWETYHKHHDRLNAIIFGK